MGRKNVGGRARKVELTLEELGESIDSAEERGFRMGLDAAERLSRLPVNECPMCEMRRELEGARARLRVWEHSDRNGHRL